MTPFPWHVGVDDSLERARELMARHDIHHLPVVAGADLVGVVSARDIDLLESRTQRSAAVGDACSRDLYVVDLAEPLDRVLAEMAERRLDSALVVKNGHLAGILTATDACRCLAQVLRDSFSRGGGEAA